MTSLSHPTVEVLVDAGAYAVLDIRLPRGLDIPRHVRRQRGAIAQLLAGVLEVREDDEAPVVIPPGAITVAEGRPIAVRVLEPARLVAILTPADAADLLRAASDPSAVADDRAALLAAAGIISLPALRTS